MSDDLDLKAAPVTQSPPQPDPVTEDVENDSENEEEECTREELLEALETQHLHLTNLNRSLQANKTKALGYLGIGLGITLTSFCFLMGF